MRLPSPIASLVLPLGILLGACNPDLAPPDEAAASDMAGHGDETNAPSSSPRPDPHPEDAVPSSAPRPGDLLVLDADAGPVREDGQHAGLVFVALSDGQGGFGAPVPWLTHDAWVDPMALAHGPDGAVIVVDPMAAGEAPGTGALFLIDVAAAEVTPYFSDARLRWPVAALVDADGKTLYITDRAADPMELGVPTGCVFSVPLGADGLPSGQATVLAAGPELQTPGALAQLPDGRLLLMEADGNPTGAERPDGLPHTPGVLFELTDAGPVARNQPTVTVSPIGLLPRGEDELFLIDANAGLTPGTLGDGAVFALDPSDLAAPLTVIVDSTSLGRRALIDPAGGDLLPDGRLVLADANLDPLKLGEGSSDKGVYARGPGAVVVIDSEAATVGVLLSSELFAMPLDVLRLRP